MTERSDVGRVVHLGRVAHPFRFDQPTMWVPHPFPSFGKGWESMVSTPSGFVTRPSFTPPVTHGRESVTETPSPHPFSNGWKKDGAPLPEPICSPVIHEGDKLTGDPLFPFRLTKKVGAPSFPIVWERVGVNGVHTFGRCNSTLLHPTCDSRKGVGDRNPVTPPVDSRKDIG